MGPTNLFSMQAQEILLLIFGVQSIQYSLVHQNCFLYHLSILFNNNIFSTDYWIYMRDHFNLDLICYAINNAYSLFITVTNTMMTRNIIKCLSIYSFFVFKIQMISDAFSFLIIIHTSYIFNLTSLILLPHQYTLFKILPKFLFFTF